MKHSQSTPGPMALVLLTAGYFAIPIAAKAAELVDSPAITKLLADTKTAAAQLKDDSADMQTFVGSSATWQSYAAKLDMIKEHVNNAGRLFAKLKDAEATGSPWQQMAIKQIEPLLRELAANTGATIKHLNENQNKVHFPAFRDYVRANYQLATDLEALIRDFMEFEGAQEKFDSSTSKLETSN
jgi:hypothetical protein